ncbi:hypothetical protein TNCV_862091 [Trichonephila clavipes]|nr:hypothetical protein TNCV_862091 [Trichonephila clavipes]
MHDLIFTVNSRAASRYGGSPLPAATYILKVGEIIASSAYLVVRVPRLPSVSGHRCTATPSPLVSTPLHVARNIIEVSRVWDRSSLQITSKSVEVTGFSSAHWDSPATPARNPSQNFIQVYMILYIGVDRFAGAPDSTSPISIGWGVTLVR